MGVNSKVTQVTVKLSALFRKVSPGKGGAFHIGRAFPVIHKLQGPRSYHSGDPQKTLKETLPLPQFGIISLHVLCLPCVPFPELAFSSPA